METIRKGSQKERAVILLQTMLVEAGFNITVDGKFGSVTDRAVRTFQAHNSLVVDGIVGQKTWITLCGIYPNLLKRITEKYLSEADLKAAAAQLDVELAAIKAVNDVESHGAGFIVDKPKILFEGHIFWQQLKRFGLNPDEYKTSNKDIVYGKWTTKYYRGGLAEYDRLERAKGIHEEAALRSASWGIFQVMGYHAEILGYEDVFQFVEKMYLDEHEHLNAFIAYVEVNKLTRYLKNLNWRAFARGYNGLSYEDNNYHIKLSRAYNRFQRF